MADKPQDFSQTIEPSHGPNVDGLDHQITSAQNDTIAARRASEHGAGSVVRLDGQPDVRGEDGLIHGDPSGLSGAPTLAAE